MDEQRVEDHVIDNAVLSIGETADEILRAIGWFKS
jgi:hypothetical protein